MQALLSCQHAGLCPHAGVRELGWLQGSSGMHPVLRLLSFSLYWLLSAPHWIACWAYFTCGERACCRCCWVLLGLLPSFPGRWLHEK